MSKKPTFFTTPKKQPKGKELYHFVGLIEISSTEDSDNAASDASQEIEFVAEWRGKLNGNLMLYI